MTSDELDRLVAEKADRWLADATALCRLADHAGLGEDTTVHVVDAAALPPEARRSAIAWTAGGLDKPLRPLLRDRRGGPVLVIDLQAVARWRLDYATLTPDLADRLGSLEVRQVALHELAHARLAEAEGRRIPAGVDLALLAAASADLPPGHDRRTHGSQWCRAYLHLSRRVSAVWPGRWWMEAAVLDVGRYLGGQSCSRLADTLKPEHNSDRPLVEILRSPAPPDFVTQFSELQERSDASDIRRTQAA